MARIAPRDLVSAIAAAKPGDRIELDSGELVGQVVIDKPLAIVGQGSGTWLGNRSGPVLIVRCSGVELHDVQIEMTGDLQHPAILIDDGCELVQRNVTIRRGEIRVDRPRLSFAAPAIIRLRESTPPVPAPIVPDPIRRAPTQPPVPPARAQTQPPAPPAPAQTQPPAPRSIPGAQSMRTPAPAAPGASGARSGGGVRLRYVVIGIGWLVVAFFALQAAERSTPRSATPSQAPRSAGTGATIPPVPTIDEIELTRAQRTNLEVVSWSPDEESFALDLGYGRDASSPARWRVRAVIDAASEKVLHWQDLSGPGARILSGEPRWPEHPAASLPTEGFQPGSVLAASRLHVRWCEKPSATHFLTGVRSIGQQVELTWDATGAQVAPEACREGDAGSSLLYVDDSPWRLMRYSPRKGGTTTMTVHASPSHRRAVVVTLDHHDDKLVARFWTRLLGPQIHILSSNEGLRRDGLNRLGVPGLLMSEDDRDPVSPPSRILVASEDDAAVQIAAPLAERLALAIERAPSDSRYLWGDVLIVLKPDEPASPPAQP
jgi:hypothetical protein